MKPLLHGYLYGVVCSIDKEYQKHWESMDK